MGSLYVGGCLAHPWVLLGRKYFQPQPEMVLKLNQLNFIGFIIIGVIATVISEGVNVYILKSWAYNQSMPIIPWLKVG